MRILIDCVVIIAFGITAFFLYQNYWDDFRVTLLQEEGWHTMYIGSNAVSITVADDVAERTQGLSGAASLKDLQGKLFIFDSDLKHGIWMKDMLIPLDIIWIDKNLQVIHFAENITPDTFPQVFAPPREARFVLEMNAHFVSSIKINIGDRITLPAQLLPQDIKDNLQL